MKKYFVLFITLLSTLCFGESVNEEICFKKNEDAYNIVSDTGFYSDTHDILDCTGIVIEYERLGKNKAKVTFISQEIKDNFVGPRRLQTIFVKEGDRLMFHEYNFSEDYVFRITYRVTEIGKDYFKCIKLSERKAKL